MAILHVDHYEYTGAGGSGAPLLLIHGWGMHGGIWGGVAEKLAHNFHVMAVDLPGHGFSALPSLTLPWSRPRGRDRGLELLDAVIAEMSSRFVDPLTVCGWSLGGQVALHWALRHPHLVKRLVMVASTPCFVQLEDWNHALSINIVEEFAASLQQNYKLTLKRFLSLQMRGSEQEREVLALLRDALFSRGEPQLDALQAGLDILRYSDFRDVLPDVRRPTLVLAGERDTLIPQQASQYLSGKIPGARLATIKGAAHAPFLSHPDEFIKHLMDFLDDTKHE